VPGIDGNRSFHAGFADQGGSFTAHNSGRPGGTKVGAGLDCGALAARGGSYVHLRVWAIISAHIRSGLVAAARLGGTRPVARENMFFVPGKERPADPRPRSLKIAYSFVVV